MVFKQSKKDYSFYFPGNLPFVGDLFSFLQNPILAFEDKVKSKGDLCQLDLAGTTVTLLLEPTTIEAVLIGHHNNLDKNDPFFRTVRSVLGTGLLTLNGEAWQSRRKMVMSVFNRGHMLVYAKVMGETIAEVLGEWQKDYIENNEKPLLNKMLMDLTLRVVVDSLFGKNALSAADRHRVSEALEILVKVSIPKAVNPIKIPDFVPSIGNLKIARCRSILYPIVENLIKNQKAHPDQGGTLFGALLAAQKNEASPPLSTEDLRDEIITTILAGHETTANALSWMFYHFSKYPQCAAKLQAEWASLTWKDCPSMSDLGKMKETTSFINESLRLFPPIWALSRQVNSAFSYHKRDFKKGEIVVFLPYLTHRLAEFWPDPDRFDPERFKNRKEEVNAAYIPFGIGPRMCVGKHFAMVEMLILLPSVLQKFEFSFQEKDVELSIGLTLRPGSNLPVSIKNRAS